jgi:hypothetical protein
MWICTKCGKTSEDHFEMCWNCQTVRSNPFRETKICPKCKSTKIIPNVRIIDRGYNSIETLSVEIYAKPDALFLKGTHRGYLSARICGHCGFTELFVDNPSELYETYESAKAKGYIA